MSESLLARLSSHSIQTDLHLSQTQNLIDQTVQNFAHHVTDTNTLASIAVGGLFSQVARLGVLSAGAGRISTPVLQVLSQGTSLFAESVAFEGTSRSLSYLQGDRSRPLFQWSGEQGWSRALPANLITFGVLRGSGHVLRDQNFVVQQLVSSGSLVAANQMTAAVGITARPEGSYSDQFFHALATNLQLHLGGGLLRQLSPGLVQLERSLSLQSDAAHFRFPEVRNLHPILSGESLALAGGLPTRFLSEARNKELNGPQIVYSKPVDVDGRPSLESISGVRSVSGEKTRASEAAEPTWAEVPGSTFRTERPIENTEQLVEAILKDALLPGLGESAVHSIFGYGSFPYFNTRTPEPIRLWDADKKPDFIIVGDVRAMIDNLAQRWGWSDAERQSIQNHARFNRHGLREGFMFFNTDLFVPGRGPVSFKISLIDREAFFSRRSNGQAALEYVQIRLKDAKPSNLIHSQNEAETLAHLEAIKDQAVDWSYLRLATQRVFTAEDIVREFYRLSYRLEIYRFWENGNRYIKPSWDKGMKLFSERRGDAPSVLLEAVRRFATQHQSSMDLTLEGQPIRPDDITAENFYAVQFHDHAVAARLARYVANIPYFAFLNARGLNSYIRHGLPSNKSSRAFYVQSPEEYAGRKARNLVYKGVTEVSQIPAIARFLAYPAIKRLPGLKKVAMDSLYYPVYYSNIPALVNGLFRERTVTADQYDALMNWYSSSPRLPQLKDVTLLRSLEGLLNDSDPASQTGAAHVFNTIRQLPMLDPTIVEYLDRIAPRYQEILRGVHYRGAHY